MSHAVGGRERWRRFTVLIALTVFGMRGGVALSEAPPESEDHSLRSYHGANGLLNRGHYELAAEEYRPQASRVGEPSPLPAPPSPKTAPESGGSVSRSL